MANSTTHANWFGPIRKARHTVFVPYLDADGDPTDPTTPDTEISKDLASYADCAEEVSTITGSNGSGYLTLSGAETDCGFLALCAKVASGPKATLLATPVKDYPVLETGTAQAGAAGTITLASGASTTDDYYNGCVVRTTGGTGGGGTGGANNQARMITDYVGSTRVATIGPANWETNPANDTTYDILLTEFARNVRPTSTYLSDMVSISGDTTAADNAESFFDGTGYAGTNNVIPTVTTVTTTTTATNLTNNLAKYMHGAVWVDTVNGASGTVSYTNGIVSNPSDSIANAKTIADNLKIKRFWIQAGSSITLGADYVGYIFDGRGYSLALGGRNVSTSQIERCEGLSGTGTCATGEVVVYDSHLNAITIGEADFVRCHLNNTVTMSQASVPYRFHDCTGLTSAKITFAAVSQTAVVSQLSGSLTIAGMTNANQTLYLDGNADVTLDNTNSAGTVYIAGNIRLTNNGAGQTINDTARWDEGQNITNVTAGVTLANGAHGGAATTITLQTPIVANATQIGGQTVSASGSITVGAFVGNATAAIAVNASGHIILADASLVTAKLGTFTLAKTTNITGFNDIAATAIVSSGAITTSGGAVSTVTNVTNNVNAVLVNGAHGGAAATLTLSALTVTTNVLGWNAAWDAEVQSEVQDAIEVNHLDHLLAADYDPASKPGVATALLNELVENDSGVSRFTANALEQAPSGGASAADIADAVWDEVLDTFHEVSGSASVLLQAAGSAGDPWVTVLGGYGAGSAGKILYDNLNAPVGTVDTVVDAIKVQTDKLNFTGTDVKATLDSETVVLTDASLTTAKLGTFVLAKTTNITGFNDIAATAIVSSGAITTSGGAVSTVTTLTNLPAITSNWLTAAGLAADAVTEIQSGLATASSLSTVAGYLDTEITDIKTVTDRLSGMLELDGAIYRYTTNALEQAPGGAGGDATLANQTIIINHLTDIKGVGWTAETLVTIEAAALAAAGAAGGTGARTVTITVNDGTTVLESALVRLTKGAETYILSTDVNGQCVFNVDDGTWVVAIVLYGYSFSGTNLVVNSDETATYSMTISPAPNLSRLFIWY